MGGEEGGERREEGGGRTEEGRRRRTSKKLGSSSTQRSTLNELMPMMRSRSAIFERVHSMISAKERGRRSAVVTLRVGEGTLRDDTPDATHTRRHVRIYYDSSRHFDGPGERATDRVYTCIHIHLHIYLSTYIIIAVRHLREMVDGRERVLDGLQLLGRHEVALVEQDAVGEDDLLHRLVDRAVRLDLEKVCVARCGAAAMRRRRGGGGGSMSACGRAERRTEEERQTRPSPAAPRGPATASSLHRRRRRRDEVRRKRSRTVAKKRIRRRKKEGARARARARAREREREKENKYCV